MTKEYFDRLLYLLSYVAAAGYSERALLREVKNLNLIDKIIMKGRDYIEPKPPPMGEVSARHEPTEGVKNK